MPEPGPAKLVPQLARAEPAAPEQPEPRQVQALVEQAPQPASVQAPQPASARQEPQPVQAPVVLQEQEQVQVSEQEPAAQPVREPPSSAWPRWWASASRGPVMPQVRVRQRAPAPLPGLVQGLQSPSPAP